MSEGESLMKSHMAFSEEKFGSAKPNGMVALFMLKEHAETCKGC
jgi:hypothetical protein